MRVPPQLNLGWIVLLASRLPGVGGLKSGRLDPLTRRDIVYIRSHVPFAQNISKSVTAALSQRPWEVLRLQWVFGGVFELPFMSLNELSQTCVSQVDQPRVLAKFSVVT